MDFLMLAVLLSIRAVLSVTFLISGGEKAIAPGTLATLLAQRSGFARFGRDSVVRVLGVAEMLTGISLAISDSRAVVAVACVLVVIFLFVVVYWRARGEVGDCGCGVVLPVSALSRAHVAYLSTLLVATVIVFLMSDHHGSPLFDRLFEFSLVFALTVSTLAVMALRSIQALHRARLALDHRFMNRSSTR